MAKRKVKIYTLGCKVNQYDSADLLRQLSDNFIIAKSNADVAIINTCCVTKNAIVKDRQMINKAKKENPKAKIVLFGCWPKSYWQEAKLQKVDLLWPVGGISQLAKKINNLYKKENNKLSTKKIAESDRSRYFIKIQDGCEQFCSYCIIPYNRGPLKSRNENEIINEITAAVERGYNEIILSGIHLGLYGKDTNTNLVTLIKKILKIKNIGRIRLSSIEITEVNNELIELIAKNKKICAHLHIPMQSGSDKILKLMKRPYDLSYYQKRIQAIRAKNKPIAITTDVIVGFPGETEAEFKNTINFIKKIGFTKLHVFPYSAHEKTLAYHFDNKVKREDALKRSKALRDLSSQLERKFIKQFRDKKLEVIIERLSEDRYTGKTEYNFDIQINKSKFKIAHKVKDRVMVKFD